MKPKNVTVLFLMVLLLTGPIEAVCTYFSSYITHNVFVADGGKPFDKLASVFAYLTVGVIAQGAFGFLSMPLRRTTKKEEREKKEYSLVRMHAFAILSASCSALGLVVALYVFQTYPGALIVPLYISLPVLFVTLGDLLIRKTISIRKIAVSLFLVTVGVLVVSLKDVNITGIRWFPIVALLFPSTLFAVREHLDQLGRRSGNSFHFTNVRILYLAIVATLLSVLASLLLRNFNLYTQIIYNKTLRVNLATVQIALLFVFGQQFLGWINNQLSTWAKGFETVTSVKILTASFASIFGFLLTVAWVGLTNSDLDQKMFWVNLGGVLLLAIGTVLLPIRPKKQT